MLDISNHPHRRFNSLTGEWIVVSPHRTKRPWQGKNEKTEAPKGLQHDASCYLCAGNTRAGGAKNPDYKQTYVFTNDFAALMPGASSETYEKGLLKAKGERGICKVVCFSPDHSLTIPEMELGDLEQVIDTWQQEFRTLAAEDFINHVQIFENKGAIMGCSNPHPHGQIWAQESVPGEVLKKTASQQAYWNETGRSLLGDYLAQELESGERLITRNDHFVALVPFWALWPFEAMIIPVAHLLDITQMNTAQRSAFAAIMKDLTSRFDRIFDTSFPYSAGIHQRPVDGQPHEYWHFHMSFYPPLLRSATVKKFMVGYEMFAEPQRDITAEMAAQRLREV